MLWKGNFLNFGAAISIAVCKLLKHSKSSENITLEIDHR